MENSECFPLNFSLKLTFGQLSDNKYNWGRRRGEPKFRHSAFLPITSNPQDMFPAALQCSQPQATPATVEPRLH